MQYNVEYDTIFIKAISVKFKEILLVLLQYYHVILISQKLRFDLLHSIQHHNLIVQMIFKLCLSNQLHEINGMTESMTAIKTIYFPVTTIYDKVSVSKTLFTEKSLVSLL